MEALTTAMAPKGSEARRSLSLIPGAKRRGLPPPPAPRSEWAYFVDLDGTLVEIAADPSAIIIDPALLDFIAALHRRCGGALALVSGRALADLEHYLAGLRIPLAGQHGLEWRDAAGVRHEASASPSTLSSGVVRRDARRRLQALLLRHPGLRLEDKGLSLALHYRQTPQLASWVHRLMRQLVAPAAGQWSLQSGKRVLEMRPAGSDKGSAIEEFMAEPPFSRRLPVFIGDDASDEHGFAVVNRLGGLSIKVGPGPTNARCRLPNVAAVRAWLALLARTGEKGDRADWAER